MKAAGLPSLPMRAAPPCPQAPRTTAAAAPRAAALGRRADATAAAPSASGWGLQRGWHQRGGAAGGGAAARGGPAAAAAAAQPAAAAVEGSAAAAAVAPAAPAPATVVVQPLPEKNFGSLRGGRYPFVYDNVYGLPVVREVASYGEVLEGLRSRRIVEVLWFQEGDFALGPEGRCLVRYAAGQVKQAVIPPTEPRLMQAIREHGALASVIPLEPRLIADLDHVPRASIATSSSSIGSSSAAATRAAETAGAAAARAAGGALEAVAAAAAGAAAAAYDAGGAPPVAGSLREAACGGLLDAADVLAGVAVELAGAGAVAGPEGKGLAGVAVEESEGERRGPLVGPTELEALLAYGTREEVEGALDDSLQEAAGAVAEMQAYRDAWLAEEAEEEAKERAGRQGGRGAAGRGAEAGGGETWSLLPGGFSVGAWLDGVNLSNEQGAMIAKYVPLLGPVVGSAFIVGLYLLARLVKGDLTDRLKMMDSESDKKKKTALKEARIAFLEEEVPGMVAKGASLDAVRQRCVSINSRLGAKLAIADSEVASTFEACRVLLDEGVDLSAASSSAASNTLAQMASDERLAAATGGEGGEEGGDPMMDMGKLSTARIRKATDPKIMDVKRRVREVRRKLKRESKVQMSDEIIFFDDIAGNHQAKVELMEVVDFFRTPQKFKASGARAPKGVLLVGPPGNGKTLMARAVAGESGVAFISSSAAEFIEMYMGLGAARVRDLFNTARSVAPCIIFIDELDAVGRSRQGSGRSNEERDNTVNQLLSEMDGFEAEQQGIVVMGATNRKDVLDAALTRPGRFDRSIEVRRPNFQGRLEAVKVHLRDKPVAADIDYVSLAGLMGGMSGAQIAGVANSACFLASREGRTEVLEADLAAAIEQAKYGKAYEGRFLGEARKRRFAILEAGISLAATLLPAIEPVEYATILPSQRSPLGRTVLKPHVGRYTTGVWTSRYLREQLLVALAGRAAEELVLGRDEMSSLQQHRLQFARQVAFKMMNAGMSDHPDYEHIRGLGQNYFDQSSEPGRFTQYTITLDSNQTRSEAIDVDMEVEARLNGSYQQVMEMMRRNRVALDALVELLLEKEKVQGEEIVKLVESLAHPQDLAQRAEWAEYELL